jgi:hypothetical protein
MNEHRLSVEMVLSAARVLLAIDIPDAIRKAERALDVGPLLDPTLWMQKHKDLEGDLAFLRAALPLWKLAHDATAQKLEEP